MKKGDVLGVAKIAGINGPKQTSNLIPLCHNIALNHVRLDLRLNPEEFSVEIEGEASCNCKTGVEMEAMTAVTFSGLTVYDMCKAASSRSWRVTVLTKAKRKNQIRGRSGDWRWRWREKGRWVHEDYKYYIAIIRIIGSVGKSSEEKSLRSCVRISILHIFLCRGGFEPMSG